MADLQDVTIGKAVYNIVFSMSGTFVIVVPEPDSVFAMQFPDIRMKSRIKAFTSELVHIFFACSLGAVHLMDENDTVPFHNCELLTGIQRNIFSLF